MFLTPTEGPNLEGMTFTQHNLTLLEVVNKKKRKTTSPYPLLIFDLFQNRVWGLLYILNLALY